MDLGLRDKVCVVTGASQGIGLEISRRLAGEGGRVLMIARTEGPLRAAAEEIGADWLAADVTDPECDERIVATCAEQMGGIDVLVNNAGTSRHVPLPDLPDEEWYAQFELNVMASMRLMRAAVPRMAERGWGRVVNVSSSSGKRPGQSNVAYSVAKAAQLSLSRAYADAYAKDGVLVNAVAPGPVATELWTGQGGLGDQAARAAGTTRDEALQATADKVPLGRLGTPQEIADVVAFLCSERVGYVTGAAWSADGGAVNIIV
jgi:NAD(P)-dependent dehydrogenase (short-subunit alcohol dehydrogenase family)